MKKYDVIILGSGPAGIITGVTVRKQNPDKAVLMIAKDEKGLVPCGIPYVFHKLDDVSKNAMGPKPFVAAGGELIVDEAVSVDPDGKSVQLQSGTEYLYDKLIFATGSTPTVPEFIKGYDLEGVKYIKKDYQYIEALKKETDSIKNIVVVGGGFIGAEVAEQLQLNGKHKVSLVELEDNCFSKAFSPALAGIATEELRKTGVNVMTGTKVDEFTAKDGKLSSVRLDSGEEIPADIVIAAVGYKPNTEMASSAGLDLNSIGAIKVDQYGRTSVSDVCAVGDCAGTVGFLTGTEDNIMLASTATAEARICGYNLFGIRIKRCFAGTLGVFSTEINGLAMAAAGVNDNTAKLANVHYVSAEFSDIDRHPGTLSDASPLSIRLYASTSDGSILGGEVWGGPTSGEIINIISLAIQKRATVYDLMFYQLGTHPLLTTAPTKPVLIKAAEGIIAKLQK
ncbi:MAG: FAD-dependent oxidoreductase [Bacteroidales bacterium]